MKYQPTICGMHTTFVDRSRGHRLTRHGGRDADRGRHERRAIHGKANHVASGKPDGKLRLSGEVPVTGPLDLSQATVTVTSLLRETSGADLVDGGDGGFPALILTARQRGKPSDATFQTPPGTGPPSGSTSTALRTRASSRSSSRSTGRGSGLRSRATGEDEPAPG